MSSEELRAKIQFRNEEKRTAKLADSLLGFREFGFIQNKEIPDWVHAAVNGFVCTDSSPQSRIRDDVTTSEVDHWVEGFSERAGLGNRFYCATGMRFFPWLDCVAPDTQWANPLRATFGNDLTLVSHSLDALVVFFEEEYEFIAFCKRDE